MEMTFYDTDQFSQNTAATFSQRSMVRKPFVSDRLKVVRLAENGEPTGEYEDFLTGFVIDDSNVWTRPVGVAVEQDGSLLLSEDGNGSIWGVFYRDR